MEKPDRTENEKIAFIQKYLEAGRTREELGAILGYKSWRGLDILMRRHGMKWDSRRNSYYIVGESADENAPEYYPSKTAVIISGFKEKDADPMEIARRAGFENHRQLSSYMHARGFVWSAGINNYTQPPSKAENPESGTLKESLPDTGEEPGPVQSSDLEKYLPLLESLLKYKERLLDLLLPASAPGTIPRYTVPGITRTKSFYMSEPLSRLLLEFSQCKNISQKEIIEAAVIEFLRKYTFKKQVDELLGRH